MCVGTLNIAQSVTDQLLKYYNVTRIEVHILFPIKRK